MISKLRAPGAAGNSPKRATHPLCFPTGTTYGEGVFRCGSFHLYQGVAYQCAWNAHPESEPHMALTRTPGTMRDGDQERWGLLLWSSDMAYRGLPS